LRVIDGVDGAVHSTSGLIFNRCTYAKAHHILGTAEVPIGGSVDSLRGGGGHVVLCAQDWTQGARRGIGSWIRLKDGLYRTGNSLCVIDGVKGAVYSTTGLICNRFTVSEARQIHRDTIDSLQCADTSICHITGDTIEALHIDGGIDEVPIGGSVDSLRGGGGRKIVVLCAQGWTQGARRGIGS